MGGSASEDVLSASGVDLSTRDQLVHDHVNYVKHLAAGVSREITGQVEFDELVAYGMKGLVEAANRYDPARGAAFTTFSYYRIRGAIYDGLRQTGWLNRSEYARFQAASNELLGNAAERGAPEVAEAEPGAAIEQVAETLDQVATIFVMSLEAISHQELPDPDAEQPGAKLELSETRRSVREAVARLPERERKLVELHYFEGLTLEAAGKQLGLSKSWASRLHARAVAALTQLISPEGT